jgi:hypothetical protein
MKRLPRLPRPALLACLLLLAPAPSSAVVMDDVAYSQPLVLGVNVQTRDLSLMRAAGIGWVRINIRWREVNPLPETWIWGATDTVVRSARAKGLKVLAVLSTAPVWAGSNANGTKPPGQVAEWQRYVRRVAARYTGRIQAYEVWNEPNLEDDGLGVGWAADLWSFPRYTDYLRAAAIQIRRYAPGTLVVGPVTSSQPNGRTVDVFRQLEEVVYPDGPAWSFLDVVSFHGNARDDQSTADVLTQIEDQLAILRDRSPSNAAKPLWLTEFGWRVGSGITEESQRDRIRNVVEALTGSGGYLAGCELCPGPPLHSLFKWTAAFLYKDVDSPGEARGIYREDRSRKPVVTDYLARLPFPARHPNAGFAPFFFRCDEGTCLFISSAVEPYVSLSYRYHWDFGDGTAGTGRVVTHTFPKAGQYFVVSGVEVPAGPVASDVRLLQVK